MSISPADKACAEVINSLKISGLTWGVQETPYSAYLTIRKKFQKSAVIPHLSVSTIGRAEEESDLLRHKLDTLNSDYNGLKASHDADKAVILKLKTDYEALEQTHDSMIKKFEDLKLEYAAEVDNSENLAKSLHTANTELQLKSDVIRSIPPDYLGALERLQNDKPCCRDRMGREKELEMKNSDLEKKSASREAFLSSLASELFELREKN